MFHSLRWRIALFVCVLVFGILATFLLATRREIERTLIRAARDRAAAATEQFTDIFARALRTTIDDNERLVSAPPVRAFAENPTEERRHAAMAVVAPRPTGTFRRVEIWTADGVRVLEISTPGKLASGETVFLPSESGPRRAGVSELRADGKLAFFDVTSEIHDATSATPRRLGYLRRYGRITLTGNFKQLFGDGAVVWVGSAGGTWTDLFVAVGGVPALEVESTIGEHRDANGEMWVGHGRAVEGTPWIAWVGFPRAQIIAPAEPFMRRMTFLAAIFLAVSTGLIAVMGVRLARRVGVLTTAAGEIAAGNYTRRVPAKRNDEIDRLARTFNSMADHVEQAHRALRDSHEQTHFALAAARIGVWESQLATGDMTCSESIAETRGLPPGAGPRTIDQFLAPVHAEDRDALRRVLRGDVLPTDRFQVSYRLLQPDGSTLWAIAKGRLKRDEHGAPLSVLGVSVDVTELRRLESQLRQSQKIEAIGQLAGGIAHDFNNLLTAIVGHGSFLLQQLPPDNPLQHDTAEILAAAERAAALTRQLLAFSRRQVLQPRVIAVNAVLADVHALIRRLIGERIVIKLSLTATPDAAKLDPGQLEQVLVNLAVNARDAMPDGGTLTIATSLVELNDAYVQQHASVSPGRYIMVSVTDTGVGMDAETQSRLFEPFFTTKAAGSGTGLGLATVYGIVKQSGGFIYTYSEIGHGSTFKIYFPATTELPTGAAAAAAAPAIGGQETILVVEDNPHVQAIAVRVLRSLGYNVLAASSGEEALDVVRNGQHVDLVVSDVIMPGMTGPEVCRQLAERYPGLRVLFTSGYSTDAIARHGVLEPGTMFIEKPYSPLALGRKVAEALGRAEIMAATGH